MYVCVCVSNGGYKLINQLLTVHHRTRMAQAMIDRPLVASLATQTAVKHNCRSTRGDQWDAGSGAGGSLQPVALAKHLAWDFGP